MLLSKNETLLFIGDSITDCERKRPVGEGLFDGWGHGYVSNVASTLCCMYPELNLRIINMGIQGEKIRDIAQRWQTDVLDRKPDWVSVLIGVNDVWRQFDCPAMTEAHVLPDEYEETYEQLIQQTLPHVKGMILMTPYFMEPNRQDAMRIRMDEYAAIVKKMAEKYGLIYIDLQGAWDKLFEHMHPANIAWDRVHPNQIGRMYIARQFLKAIGADR